MIANVDNNKMQAINSKKLVKFDQKIELKVNQNKVLLFMVTDLYHKFKNIYKRGVREKYEWI